MVRSAAAPVLVLSLVLTACPQAPAPGADLPLLTTLDFRAYDGQAAALGLREGKSRQVSLDAEPESIAVGPDGRKAYVTVQESNAVATVDLTRGRIEALRGLGTKDHRRAQGALDASDRDGAVNIRAWPVEGAHMPDGVAAVAVGGRTYVLTANEGDARDYGEAYQDEVRVGGLTLDPAAFPNAAELQADAALGRLTVSAPDADTDGDGDADRLVAFGARSLSVWDADLTLVADTGDLFERKTAERSPTTFNSNGTASTFDTRSDNKGPEPEGVAVGVVGGKTLAFVGLERTGGVLVLDVSAPQTPRFVDHQHVIAPGASPASGAAGDLGPEGILFIGAADSPNGKPLLVASHEVSGSVTLYGVEDSGRLTLAGRHQAEPFVYDRGVAEISAYDKASRRLFVVNGNTGDLDILDIANVAQPRPAGTIDLAAYGRAANSVAAHGGTIAVAVEANVKTDPGTVAFFNADGTVRAPALRVGAQPDMLTFSPDGALLLVAGEGEPSADYRVDPPGTVSLINVPKALAAR